MLVDAFQIANVFYNSENRPKVVLIEENTGIARNFSNKTYGIILLSLAAATIIAVVFYLIVQRKRGE